MNNELMFSSKSDEYSTPIDFFEKLNAEFHFTLDPCCTEETAKCKRYFTKEDDGLNRDWQGETVFVNPPYSNISQWVEKAWKEGRNNCGDADSIQDRHKVFS